MLVEAYLMSKGPKDASRYLRALAAILAEPKTSKIVSLRDTRETSETIVSREWLRERLSLWLARHG